MSVQLYFPSYISQASMSIGHFRFFEMTMLDPALKYLELFLMISDSGFVFQAGSKDGNLRLWKCSADCRRLEPLFAVPVVSFFAFFVGQLLKISINR